MGKRGCGRKKKNAGGGQGLGAQREEPKQGTRNAGTGGGKKAESFDHEKESLRPEGDQPRERRKGPKKNFRKEKGRPRSRKLNMGQTADDVNSVFEGAGRKESMLRVHVATLETSWRKALLSRSNRKH